MIDTISSEILAKHILLFRESFYVMSMYAANRDRFGMTFSGWLADALHNYPELLMQGTSASILLWPEVRRLRGSDGGSYDEVILSITENAESLKNLNASLQLAPAGVIISYLNLIEHFLIQFRNRWASSDFSSTRQMQVKGRIHEVGDAQTNLDKEWANAGSKQSLEWGNLARVLADVSDIILSWDRDKALSFHSIVYNDDSIPIHCNLRYQWTEFFSKAETRQ